MQFDGRSVEKVILKKKCTDGCVGGGKGSGGGAASLVFSFFFFFSLINLGFLVWILYSLF